MCFRRKGRKGWEETGGKHIWMKLKDLEENGVADAKFFRGAKFQKEKNIVIDK